MAGQQPDISSILAALAGRSQGTPAQGAPAPQAGYQGYPAQVPTPQLGGFALPQPTNSGSVDLSQIRPVNSGSVSLADAIAKARSIAQDKGFHDTGRQPQAPLRDDPRLAGRAPIRSRSRSPGRRDAFRDNYNPYRDERRDMDRRDRNFQQRDRSNSPGARARANFSPIPQQRASRPSPGAVRNNSNSGASGGNDTETISVNSSLVGLIIGRQGENLRRVESETGARVQFIPARDASSTQRQCTISGPLRARENAKREIYRVIDENGGPGDSAPPPDTRGGGAGGRGGGNKQSQQPALREGENSIQIMVPDKTVGLIIGRGGETIRDLQERSGCHVNIVAENKSIGGLRPVNLIGTPQAAQIAQDMILEIVESDTQGRANNNNNNNPAPAQRHTGGYDSYAQPGQGGGYGAPAAAGYGGRDDGGKTNEDIFVPSEAVGMIIGKGGETIKEMQNVTGCKINVSQPQQPDIQRQIGLVGTRAAIEEAKRAINEKVDTVQQRDRQGGRDRGNNRNDAPGDRYSQPQQQMSYGQQPMGGAPQGMQGMPGASAMAMPGMPQAAAAAPTGGDPNAPDPYAPYGGYANYVALWYAAQLAQSGGQGQQPPAQ